MESQVNVLPLLLMAAVVLFYVYVGWRIFTKAGRAGWKSLIPIYNAFVLLDIVGRPAWWFILTLIPVVNIIVMVVLSVDLAKSFGKGTGFGIGLFLLGFIFGPMLAFGSAEYAGPSARASQQAASGPTQAV
jgi:hypothetical protein